MRHGVDRKKLAAWQRRLKRQAASGLTVAEFCRRERVSESLWCYWRQRVEEEAAAERLPRVAKPAASAFQAVEVVGGRAVLVRFPGGVTLEIPCDRGDLVRLAIDCMAGRVEASSC